MISSRGMIEIQLCVHVYWCLFVDVTHEVVASPKGNEGEEEGDTVDEGDISVETGTLTYSTMNISLNLNLQSSRPT